MEKQNFRVYVRHYASGYAIACTEQECESAEQGPTEFLNDLESNDKDAEGPYREYPIAIASTPPLPADDDAVASVDVPDAAVLPPVEAEAAAI